MGATRLNLGATTRGIGESQRANELLAESLVLFEGEGNLRMIAIARTMLGLVAVQEGDHARATAHLATALAAHPDRRNVGFVIWNLLGLAQVLFAQGRRSEAARILGAAEVQGERAGAALARIGQVNNGPFLAEVAALRRETRFAATWEDGRTLTLDHVVEFALAQAGVAPSAGASARLTPPAAPTPPTPPPAAESLTRREHEVALLVA